MPRHLDTKHKLLMATQRRLQQSSYNGFSFRDIADDVDIRKASVYSHYPSKELLLVAMLETVSEGLQQWCQATSSRPPTERLRAYCLELYGDGLNAGECLCPVGALFSNWQELPENVQLAAKQAMSIHEDFVQKALLDGSNSGSIAAADDIALQAQGFICQVQGALAVSRAMDGRAYYDSICEQLLAQLTPN